MSPDFVSYPIGFVPHVSGFVSNLPGFWNYLLRPFPDVSGFCYLCIRFILVILQPNVEVRRRASRYGEIFDLQPWMICIIPWTTWAD